MANKIAFRDRAEAGRLLGAELAKRKLGATHRQGLIVMALARGGVPVGLEIAEALQAPLEVMVVRKLGVPWQPELAMGALARGTVVLDRALIAALDISSQEVDRVAAREALELERRERKYRRREPVLTGRTVILVDDGLATGSTMVAAVRYARNAGAHEVIVAVPVGSSEGCERLQSEADECICLTVEQPFHAVGEWYQDFHQVSDAEVLELLERCHARVGTS